MKSLPVTHQQRSFFAGANSGRGHVRGKRDKMSPEKSFCRNHKLSEIKFMLPSISHLTRIRASGQSAQPSGDFASAKLQTEVPVSPPPPPLEPAVGGPSEVYTHRSARSPQCLGGPCSASCPLCAASPPSTTRCSPGNLGPGVRSTVRDCSPPPSPTLIKLTVAFDLFPRAKFSELSRAAVHGDS